MLLSSILKVGDEYPDKLLREFPDGRLESVTVNMKTGKIIVLEVLRDGKR